MRRNNHLVEESTDTGSETDNSHYAVRSRPAPLHPRKEILQKQIDIREVHRNPGNMAGANNAAVGNGTVGTQK